MRIRKLTHETNEDICIQIVQSYPDKGGGTRERLVRTVGSASPGPLLENLIKTAEREIIKLEEERSPSSFPEEFRAEKMVQARRKKQSKKPLPIADLRQLQEFARICLGFHEVVGSLYEQMGFTKIFTARQVMFRRLFKQAVLLRLASPGDHRLPHTRRMSKDMRVEVPVERFHRMMDAVTDKVTTKIKKQVCNETLSMTGETMNVLFWDMTTLSFADEVEDDFHQTESGKNDDPYQEQFVVALVQTQEGFPVTYELFPGNTADAKTLGPILEQLRKQFAPERMIVVANAEMSSENNLALLKSLDCDYMIATHLRTMDQAHAKIIMEKQSRETLSADEKITECTLNGRRLILRYCPEKAARDAHKREKAVKKVKKNLERGRIQKGRVGRFLKVDQDSMSLDEKAVQHDALFDGLHGVWTSLTDMEPEKVYTRYGELWRTEEAFRPLKHTMAVGPMFRWTEQRVRAHVAICFVSLALLRILRHRHNTMFGDEEQLSEERILSELCYMEASLVCDQGAETEYLIPSSPTKEGAQLCMTVGEPIKYQMILFDP